MGADGNFHCDGAPVGPTDTPATLDALAQAQDVSKPIAAPNPEVSEKPARRRFTSDYKRRILHQADACSQPGQIGALLRREGLYSSHLRDWRLQRERALSQGLAPRPRGRRPTRHPLAEDLARAQRDNVRLRRRLAQAELIIDIQKKTSQLLGLPLADVPDLEPMSARERNS